MINFFYKLITSNVQHHNVSQHTLGGGGDKKKMLSLWGGGGENSKALKNNSDNISTVFICIEFHLFFAK